MGKTSRHPVARCGSVRCAWSLSSRVSMTPPVTLPVTLPLRHSTTVKRCNHQGGNEGMKEAMRV